MRTDIRYRSRLAMIAASVVLAVISGFGKTSDAMTLTLHSPAFAANAEIPAVHTCEGQDMSPPLSWSGIPNGTQSLALIVTDPDAPDPASPQRTWTHWLLYNLPASSHGIPPGAKGKDLPAGTREGKNDWKRPGYGGPCPPIGRHRYFFRLVALDTVLPDLGHPDRATLEKAMQGHIVAQTELIGLYQKKKH